MTHVTATASEAWLDLLGALVTAGERRPSRNGDARELLAHRTTLAMSHPVVTVPARALGYRFQAAEAAWVLSGSNRLDEVARYARRMADFSDDGLTLAGAYGPPVVDQLPYVVRALASDPGTRQALLTTWRPSPGPSRDVPCTLALQFLVRDGRLSLVATMRSSDAWLGWPYDVFTFTMVAATVLLRLRSLTANPKPPFIKIGVQRELLARLKLGDLHLTAGSQHLYEWNVDGAVGVTTAGHDALGTPIEAFDPGALFADDRALLDHLRALARGTADPGTWRARL